MLIDVEIVGSDGDLRLESYSLMYRCGSIILF